MKREMYVFLCVIVILFFGSCADLSMDKEEAVIADLPKDFDWKVYGEINGDVLMNQIIKDLEKTKRGDDSTEKCVSVLSSDTGFAKIIYEDYLQCPVERWEKKEKCTGKFANNSSYNKPTTETIYTSREDTIKVIDTIVGSDTTYKDSTITIIDSTTTEYPSGCVIENCWSEGWSGTKFLEASQTNSETIKDMCKFIPENTTSTGAKNYLEDFKKNKFDPYLVEQHYHFFGRTDGRPYKYCDSEHGDEKKQNLEFVVRRYDGARYYYDYGRYTFCLDKSSWKIYVVK